MPDASASEPGAPLAWRELLPDAVPAAGAVPWLAPAAVDHLGDPDGERVALLGGAPSLVPRVAAGHLRVVGADRLGFVHGLVSHDVVGLRDGEAVEALLLDHRGAPRAGLIVHRRPADLYLAVEDGAGPAVATTLREHVVFDQVEVEDLGGRLAQVTLVADGGSLAAACEAAWRGTGGPVAGALATAADVARGTPARATLALPTGPSTTALLRPRSWGAAWAVEVQLLARDLPGAWQAWTALGFRAVGERAWTAARVAHGVATALGEGRLGLPQETGLEDRVSYRKGCYLGQEIMARVEARGRLRRGLARLRLAGPPPALGRARGWRLEDAAGQPIGALGSAAPAPDGDGWWALAVVRLGLPPDAVVRVAVDGDVRGPDPSVVEASVRDAPGGL